MSLVARHRPALALALLMIGSDLWGDQTTAAYHRILAAGAPSSEAELAMVEGFLAACRSHDIEGLWNTKRLLDRVPEVYQAVGRGDAIGPWSERVRSVLSGVRLAPDQDVVRQELFETLDVFLGDRTARVERARRELAEAEVANVSGWRLAELHYALGRGLVAADRREEARPSLMAAFECVDSGRYFQQRIQQGEGGLASLAYSLMPQIRFMRMRQLASTLDEVGLPSLAARSRGQAAELERLGDAARWSDFDRVALALEGGDRARGLQLLERLLASRHAEAGSPLETHLARIHEAAAGLLYRVGEARLAQLHVARLAWAEGLLAEPQVPTPLLDEVVAIVDLGQGDDPEGRLRSRLLEAAFDRFPRSPARPDRAWIRTLGWFLALPELHARSGGTAALWRSAQQVLLGARETPREVLAGFLEEALGSAGVAEAEVSTLAFRARVVARYGDDPVLSDAWDRLAGLAPSERDAQLVDRAAARRRWLDAGRPAPPSTSPGWLD